MKKLILSITMLSSILVFGQTQTNQVNISGKIGINTTNPAKELEVVGETVLDGKAEIKDTLTVTDVELSGTLKLEGLADPTCTSGSFLSVCSEGNVSSLSIEDVHGILYDPDVVAHCNLEVGFSYPAPVWSSTGGTDPLLFTGAYCPAKVGIGTDHPQAKLDVRGSGRFGTSFPIFINEDGISSVNDKLWLNKNNGHDVEIGISGGTTNLHVEGSSLLHGEVRIDAGKILQVNRIETAGGVIEITGSTETSGSVAIGTTIQSGYALSVCGKIGSREVKVKANNGWCDYVFENDYNLMSLTDVEEFITENKHLPEIPSAIEVEENGIEVSVMMEKMMKKIEELTLYTIEQEKRINELEKKN
ncbi:MAG: Uncharacterised protein [Cryomorphaceae bacterium]|jgi:hypothetical protein|nr:MAG: Uncharacterised protein [Cryomorphaceae bacterium]